MKWVNIALMVAAALSLAELMRRAFSKSGDHGMVRFETISCPVCHAPTKLKIYFGVLAMFKCSVCNTKGYGRTLTVDTDALKDEDILIHDDNDNNED